MLSDLQVVRWGDWVVVSPVGELDLASLPRLRSEVVALVAEGERQVVLDLAGVDFIDSAGLGGVVAVAKRVVGHGGEFRIARAEPQVWSVFAVVGLDRVFGCHDDLDTAVAAPAVGPGGPQR